jgi:hypothetical protein
MIVSSIFRKYCGKAHVLKRRNLQIDNHPGRILMYIGLRDFVHRSELGIKKLNSKIRVLNLEDEPGKFKKEDFLSALRPALLFFLK